MELWIRSQTKVNLMLVNDIYVNDNYIYAMKEEHSTLLGKYSTEKRALEVLDEIQKLLMPKIIVTDDKQQMINSNGVIYSIDIIKNINTDIQELSTYVYQMPKE